MNADEMDSGDFFIRHPRLSVFICGLFLLFPVNYGRAKII